MQVDIHSLGLFSRLGREGAGQAASSLTQLTGADIHVDVTNITLMSRQDLRERFDGQEFVGVQIGFEGGLEGETVLLFERDQVGTLLELLMPGMSGGDELDAMAKSGVKEVGNIMSSGFLDGWANHLGTAIDITPPTYVERSGADILPNEVFEPVAGEQVFLFTSQLEAVDADVNFYIYMLPEYGAFTEVMASQSASEDTIPVDKLTVFNQMTKTGAEQAATNVSSLTGVETDVEVSRLSFVPIEDVPRQVDDGTHVGVVVGFDGLPSGYLVILFDEASAHNVTEALLPVAPDGDGDGFGDMAQSAIKEIGNIMTSGFIDGWANVLQTSIDHTPPQFVHDMGDSIMSPVIGQLGQTQDYAFVLDSAIQTDGSRFTCDIYALPDETELKRALDTLLVERADKTHVDADQVF